MSAPRRLFIALGLPARGRRHLEHSLQRLAVPEMRPTAVANYHLTLVFLGDPGTTPLNDYRDILAACAPAEAPLLEVERIAAFPGPGSRLIAALLRSTPALESLQGCLATRIAQVSGAAEQHTRWRPHITLGRMPRDGAPPAPLELELTLRADELGLYEGVHSSRGYRYQCLARHSWRGSPLSPNRSSSASGSRG